MDITPFKNIIRERTGLSFDRAGLKNLEDEILKRMDQIKIASPEEYLVIISSNDEEFLCLINIFTIKETYFFREPVYIRIFSDYLIPQLMASGKKIKILSAGCSTGEEPYSLAIALIEKFGVGFNHLFSIIGIDINKNYIYEARNGIYNQKSFRSIDPQILNRYFEPVEKNRYKIKQIIKTIVDFDAFNLLTTHYPTKLQYIDIIFYRNVSIYFEKTMQKKIFNQLVNNLNENGYLIVSSTETLPHDFNILPLIEINGVFLFHKPVKQAFLSVHRNQTELSDLPTEVNRKSEILNLKSIDDALAAAKIKRYNEAVSMLDEIIKTDPSLIKAYTLKAEILMNIQEIDTARDICLHVIEKEPLCIQAYLILGIIEKIETNIDEALKKFKEAVYIDTSNWLAHFYLGDIYQAAGYQELAIREYQIVMNLLEKGKFHDHGLLFFPFSFSKEQMIHMLKDRSWRLTRQNS